MAYARSIFNLGLTLLLVMTSGTASGADNPPVSKPPLVVAGPSKEEYRERRQKLMSRIKQDEAAAARPRGESNPPLPGSATSVVVLVGAGEPGEDAKFRQENDFWYLTGVDAPQASVILWPETGEETLYLPPRNRMMDRWVGPRLGPGPEGVAGTGFARVESTGAFLGDLFRAIADPRTARASAASVYLLEPAPRPTSQTGSSRFSRFVREGAPTARFKDLALLAHEMRKGKSEAEATLIRKAVAVTADAQREVVRLIRPGVPEYRLEGAILGAFTAGGAQRAGFPSIVGSGPNSTVLHYSKNDRTLDDGDLCVIDIGGEYNGYTADITRTYPVNGRFTPRQRDIYQLVRDAQAAAEADFKPGVSTIGSLEKTAREVLKKSPLRAKDADGVEQAMDRFFVHGLGHQMGLDVHDVGDNSKPLMPGEVFTIEPGIYLSSEALGVRIEDDYRATADGLEKLSKAIPVEVEDIERLIGAARKVQEPASPATP